MSDDVSRATNEFLAEELSADAKATEQAAEVQAALNPPTPEQTTHGEMHDAPAPQLPQIPPAQLKKLANVILGVCDRIIVAQAGKEFALQPSEKSDIADAAVPVMAKYLPSALGFLVTTPEGVLLTTVAIIYGSKAGLDVMGLVDEPAETEQPTTTEQPKTEAPNG